MFLTSPLIEQAIALKIPCRGILSEIEIFRQLSRLALFVQYGNGDDGSENEETIQNRIHDECEEHCLLVPI